MTALTRTYSLPFGFTVEFAWSADRLDVFWQPDVPRIRKPRPWRKLFNAYKDARRAFYEEVAALIGGTIMIVDTDLKKIVGTEVIARPTKH